MILVLKAWGKACVVATREPVWGFLVPKTFGPHQSGNTSGFAYRQRAGGHQRSSFSAAGGMSWGLLATQRHWTHSRDIHQSLHEQHCHFLCECWKINLAVNLSLLCLRLLSALYKWRKVQPEEYFITMNHSEVAKVQLVMLSLIGRLFSSKVRCVLVLV